jgi:hypothetical protein
VTNNASHNPVALLYAGSSTTTIGNPIGEVLDRLEDALPGTQTISFVGSGGSSARVREVVKPERQGVWPSDEAIEFATLSMRQRERELMSRPSVIGIGVGARDENSAEAAIVIYVNQSQRVRPRLPRSINGVPVRIVYTDQITAY